jgi:cell filamentation protein, protein adenylyltransferase
MKRGLQGHYISISTVGEKAEAFVPNPQPPLPAIEWSVDLREKYDQALLALGRLDSVSVFLPDTSLFLNMVVRKEAVLSSMIEGTRSSLSDLLMFESDHQPEVPIEDVQEVSNYVAALNHGLKRLGEDFPVSLRLIKEIHTILLSKGIGKNLDPGEFRRSQNWIGGSRPGTAIFVPPPPEKVLECMGQLELYLHDQPEKTPILIKVALAHVQFESIHPFLDGNGRLGRLLITLLLCSHGVLREPMLYLSLYFKSHRDQYYRLLNDVNVTGDWESWLEFFADAVVETAKQAVESILQLIKLTEADSQKIGELKRGSGSAYLVHKAMLEKPIASPNWIQKKTQLSAATVNSCLRQLEQLGILKEITGRKRDRLYSYFQYINIMNRGTELPESKPVRTR